MTAKDVFEQIERLRARVHERVGWPAFDFLLEAVDALPHKFLIVEHHARKAGGRHEWIFAVDKAAGRRVVENVLTIQRLDVVVLPEIIQRVHTVPFAFGQLFFKGAQLVKHAIVAHAANAGDGPESNGEKIESSRDQVVVFDGTKQSRINCF